MTAGRSSRMPSAARCTSASRWNAAVITTAAGTPSFSRLTASCKLHDVQEPQSPMAVSTTSLSAAMAATSSGAATREKLSFWW